MIATLISFQAIDITYTPDFDPTHHLLIDEATPGIYTVVKNGLKLRSLFETMIATKNLQIEQEHLGHNLSSPLFVCLSPKTKKVMQPVFRAIHSQFEDSLVYFHIDKGEFGEVVFNRPLLRGRDICFGEGFSQLRPKEELRIALANILKPTKNVEFIFIEKNQNQLKQLKKQGFTNIVDSFDPQKYIQAFSKAKQNLTKSSETNYSQQFEATLQKYPFVAQYLQSLQKSSKQVNIKHIEPFNTRRLTIAGFIHQLCTPSSYYNITPKSWANREPSKQISSYVFHSLTDHQLHIARASKPKDFSNEEDIELKVLAYYLNFLVNPEALVVPHDKNTTLMKFSKIKAYQNKKAFLNIRPYIEQLRNLKQCSLEKDDYLELFLKGQLFGKKVQGIGGMLLSSWLINQSFVIKTLSEQLTLMTADKQRTSLTFLDKNSARYGQGQLVVCRTDFFNIFNQKTFRVLDDRITVDRAHEEVFVIRVKELNESILEEMCQLADNLGEERETMMRSLFLHYGWNTKLSYYYDIVVHRLEAIRGYLADCKFTPIRTKPLLFKYPQLSCLLIPENYDYFMLPSKTTYFPLNLDFQDQLAKQKQAQNPYLTYMNKTCSFAIYKLQFPVLTFLQWTKASGRYQVIEYISMINHSLEQYLVMDKRLKLTSVNDKKSVVLIVDHVELCEALVTKPKNIKTIMIFRLRKAAEMEDFGVISEDIQKQNSFQEGKDQLIAILHKWGTQSKLLPSKVQLYDWILAHYTQIKCTLYALPKPGNLQFLSILHKAISTNRHRVKQLQDNHKDKFRYLYTYPILKENQKIIFNYRLMEFLHLKVLFTEVLEGRWQGKLETCQNASVKLWRSIIDADLACQIVNKVLLYLNDLSEKKMEGSQYKQQANDSLQLILSLTEQQNHATTMEPPYNLYFQVFAELVKIQNYQNIQDTLTIGQCLVVIEEDNIEIIKGPQTVKISKQQTKVLASFADQNQLLVLDYDIKANQFYINAIQITNAPILGFSKVFSERIQDNHLKKILLEANWDLFKIVKSGNNCILGVATDKTVIITVFSIMSQQPVYMHEHQLQKTVIDLQFIHSGSQPLYLLGVTSEEVVKIRVDQESIREKPLSLLKVESGITRILFLAIGMELHIYLYKLHIIEHFVVAKNEVVSQTRFELKRNARVIACRDRQLYVFYENCDVLDIFVIRGHQIERVWSYYWVEHNCQTLHINGDDLYLRGSSYLKRVRIRNPQSLRAQLLKLGGESPP